MASWPSVKMSASTRTWSPTVRLAGKRPQSTCGVIPSIMTRLRPSDLIVVIAMSRSCKILFVPRYKSISVGSVATRWPVIRLLLFDQAPVQVNGLMRNRRPTENVFHPPPARIAKTLALLWVLQEFIDARRQDPSRIFPDRAESSSPDPDRREPGSQSCHRRQPL